MVALRSGLPVIGVVMGVFHPGDQDWRWIRIDAHPRHDSESGADFKQTIRVISSPAAQPCTKFSRWSPSLRM
ncbi:hypothetical protein CCP4SC76_3320003 [Gammaproteobacteria bacterium]